MNHYWSGGTTDPKYASFTDPKGPSGAEASWAFLKRYRKSDTAMPCAEAPVAPVRATCPARTVTVTLARGARVRRVLAWVAGRRVRTTIRGRRVRLTLPAGRKGAVRVVLRVRRDRYFVPMAQPQRGLVPLLLDGEAAEPMVAATRISC